MPYRVEGPDYFEATVLHGNSQHIVGAYVVFGAIGVLLLASWHAPPVFLMLLVLGGVLARNFAREMSKRGQVCDRFVFDHGHFSYDGWRGKWSFDSKDLRSIEVSHGEESQIRFQLRDDWHTLGVLTNLDYEALTPLCNFLKERFPDRYTDGAESADASGS